MQEHTGGKQPHRYISHQLEQPTMAGWAHQEVDEGEDEDGFVAPPRAVRQPRAQQRGQVARALKQVQLRPAVEGGWVGVGGQEFSQVDMPSGSGAAWMAGVRVGVGFADACQAGMCRPTGSAAAVGLGSLDGSCRGSNTLPRHISICAAPGSSVHTNACTCTACTWIAAKPLSSPMTRVR